MLGNERYKLLKNMLPQLEQSIVHYGLVSYNDDFKYLLKEKFNTELEEMINEVIDGKNIRAKAGSFEMESVGYWYTDVDLDYLKSSENDYILNFNGFGKIIKNLFHDSFIETFSIIQDKLSVDREILEEFGLFVKGIYYVIKDEIEQREGKQDINLAIYMPETGHWTVMPVSGQIIYAIFQEFFLYASGIIIYSHNRSPMADRISETLKVKIDKKNFITLDTPENTIRTKLIVALKNCGYKGNLGEFFTESKGLVKYIVNILCSMEYRPLEVDQSSLYKFAQTYMDWIERINTIPAELLLIKQDLESYEVIAELVNEDEKENIQIVIDSLKEQIEKFEITQYKHSFGSFVKFVDFIFEDEMLKPGFLPAEFNKYLTDADKDSKEIEETIKNFDRIFNSRILGQSHIIAPLWSVLKKWYVGVRSSKPIGSFLFCGPTGVGKTETAKLLSELFGNLIAIDMSEYQSEIDKNKIIGVAPGYAGYDQGAGVLDKIASNPRSVVLFDEIEKAHPAIFDLLLQVLDEGRLTDHKGNIVSFKECLVICTSNAHYNEIVHLGYNTRNKIIEVLAATFRKEFLARFNDILKYNNLNSDILSDIFEIKLDKKLKELGQANNTNITLIEDEAFYSVKSNVISFMDSSLGAREVDRKLEEEIVSKILEDLVQSKMRGELLDSEVIYYVNGVYPNYTILKQVE